MLACLRKICYNNLTGEMEKDSRVQKLLEQGLYHYGIGETSVAVELWRQVMALDPENEVAGEYLSIELGPYWQEKLNLKPFGPERAKPVVSALEKPTQTRGEEVGLGKQHLLAGKPDQAFLLFGGLLEQEPDNSVYRSYLELSKAALFKAFLNQVGGLDQAPLLAGSASKIMDLRLNEEEGFMLSLLNGEDSFRDILSVAPMPPFQAFYILKKFMTLGLLRLKGQG